jgi:hypothetical protein
MRMDRSHLMKLTRMGNRMDYLLYGIKMGRSKVHDSFITGTLTYWGATLQKPY